MLYKPIDFCALVRDAYTRHVGPTARFVLPYRTFSRKLSFVSRILFSLPLFVSMALQKTLIDCLPTRLSACSSVRGLVVLAACAL